jgi:hypothetical protein
MYCSVQKDGAEGMKGVVVEMIKARVAAAQPAH